MTKERIEAIKAYAKTAEYALTMARMEAKKSGLHELADKACLSTGALIGACEKQVFDSRRSLAGATAGIEV